MNEFKMLQKLKLTWGLNDSRLKMKDNFCYCQIPKSEGISIFLIFLIFKPLCTYFLDCGNRNFSFKNLMDHDTIKRIQKKNFCK